MREKHEEKESGIKVTTKEEYSFCQKICCCRCFSCLQEERVMDSDTRKVAIRRLVDDYKIEDDVPIPLSRTRECGTPSS